MNQNLFDSFFKRWPMLMGIFFFFFGDLFLHTKKRDKWL